MLCDKSTLLNQQEYYFSTIFNDQQFEFDNPILERSFYFDTIYLKTKYDKMLALNPIASTGLTGLGLLSKNIIL